MALSKKVRTTVYERDNYHCRSCNRTQGLHPHHIKYVSAGGEDTLENLVTVCWVCHRAIHDGFLSVLKVPQPDVEYRLAFIRQRGWTP